MNDPVNHPSHYEQGGVEVIDAIEAWQLGYHLGNAVKYIARAGKKDPTKLVEDLKKARWYLDRKIAMAKRSSVESVDTSDDLDEVLATKEADAEYEKARRALDRLNRKIANSERLVPRYDVGPDYGVTPMTAIDTCGLPDRTGRRCALPAKHTGYHWHPYTGNFSPTTPAEATEAEVLDASDADSTSAGMGLPRTEG